MSILKSKKTNAFLMPKAFEQMVLPYIATNFRLKVLR